MKKDDFLCGMIIVFIVFAILTIPILQYKAYKARFPKAPMWTFFFQGGR